jgi:predicted nucleic acid-binding Zn ribbon protein
VQAFSDAPLTTCDVCGGTLKKIYGAVGIVFKGSGFYKTDSRSSGTKRSSEAAAKSNGDGAAASSESTSSTSEKLSAASSSTPVQQKDAAATK